jgi:hypothetical protein
MWQRSFRIRSSPPQDRLRSLGGRGWKWRGNEPPPHGMPCRMARLSGASRSASRLIVHWHFRIGIAGSAGAAFSLRGSSRTAWMLFLPSRGSRSLTAASVLAQGHSSPQVPAHLDQRTDQTSAFCRTGLHPSTRHTKAVALHSQASTADLNGLRDDRPTGLYRSGMVTLNRYRIHQARKREFQRPALGQANPPVCSRRQDIEGVKPREGRVLLLRRYNGLHNELAREWSRVAPVRSGFPNCSRRKNFHAAIRNSG